MLFRLFVCIALGWPIAGTTQPVSPTSPVDPGAAVPQPRYDSAFSRYRRFEEAKPGSWRDLNAEVQKSASPAVGTRAPAPSAADNPPADVPVRKPRTHQH